MSAHTGFTTFLLAIACSSMTIAAGGESRVGKKWREQVAESATHLKQGEYERALRIADRVIGEMVDLLGPGDDATRAFGIVLTHKALAKAGMGETEDALWYWHTVLSLYPRFADSDLSMFGAPGEFLKNNPLPPRRETSTSQTADNYTPPKLLKKKNPEFPSGALAFGSGGVLSVELIITSKGEVTSPRVVKPLAAPTLSYAALEAVKKWRFEPGKIDGQPVDVPFALSVNYKFGR